MAAQCTTYERPSQTIPGALRAQQFAAKNRLTREPSEVTFDKLGVTCERYLSQDVLRTGLILLHLAAILVDSHDRCGRRIGARLGKAEVASR